MKFWQKSLMARLVGYFLLLSLAIGALSVFVAYIQGKNALEKSVHDRLIAAATLQENELNRWLEDQQQVVIAIARLPQIQAQAALLLNHANTGADVDSSVFAVAFSPDGQQVATGGIDQTVRLWNLDAAGQEMTKLDHSEGVNIVVFSPDGQLLATASWDFTVRIWETSSGKELARIVHQDEITDLDFSPDGRRLATGAMDGMVTVWEATTGQQITQIAEISESVTAIAFSPDGQWLATASQDNTGRVWEVTTGQEIARTEHEGWVLSVAFSPDGQWLAVASQDRTARILEIATGQEIARLAHEDWVTGVTFSPDGRRLATASDDGTVRLWEVATGEEIARLEHETPVLRVLFSPDGQWLLSLERESASPLIWDVNNKEIMAALTHESSVTDIAFSPDSKWVATASYDGLARVWKAPTGQELFQLKHDSLPYTLLTKSLTALSESKADLQQIFILAKDGHIIVATDKAYEGQNQANTEYFSRGKIGAFVQNVYLSPLTNKPTITIATPFYDKSGQTIGVLAADLNLARMDAIVAEHTGLGETGVTYLVNRDNQLVAAADFGEQVHSQGIEAALQGQDGSGHYPNYENTPVVGIYRWLDNMDLALLAEMDQREASASARQLAMIVSLTGLIAAVVLATGVYILARQIARPILVVADAAAAVEAETFETERLDEVAKRADEVGLLARVFQSMARKVYAREQSLKKQVQELRIEIDDLKRQEEVEKIVDTDFFRDLQTKARVIRRQHKRSSKPDVDEEIPA